MENYTIRLMNLSIKISVKKFFNSGVFRFIVLLLITAWFAVLMADKIDLTTADIGRHLKNGELLLAAPETEAIWNSEVLNSNFYSYTNPEFPTINHHWGSGIIFFIVWTISGFVGLSLFYIALSCAIFLLFFSVAQKSAGFWNSAAVSLFAIPVMASRTEVRPEIFSYFFIALFFWLLWNYKNGQFPLRRLFILPALMALWVNIHIYFIFGFFLIGLFLFEALLLLFLFRKWRNEKVKNAMAETKKLSVVFLLSAAASFLNPSGAAGALYPLNIFKNYGYRLVENQSVAFLERLKFYLPEISLFKILFLFFIISFILALIANYRKISIIHLSLGAVFGVMAWLAIRNFALFGFFALPITASNIKITLDNLDWRRKKENQLICVWIIFILALIFNGWAGFKIFPPRLHKGAFGIGLAPQNNGSAEFFQKEKIKGPIFNNYDIGGYLIYHLFPKEKVFVDNRPEAYSSSFFQNIYIPMQQDDDFWKEQSKVYNFNAIFFSHRDATPWGQEFLFKRMRDPLWERVFTDQYAVIFLKK